MNFLIIDLNKTATDKMCFTCLIFSNRYYLTKRSRNDSSCLLAIITTHHSMRLSTSSLSISKDSAIVSFEHTVDQGEGALFIDEVLRAISSKDSVKSKIFRLFFTLFF